MFQSFSESARRVVFWPRHEAGRLGADAIELEHLLLGFVSEDQGESEAQFRKYHGLDDSAPVKIDGGDSEPRFLSPASASNVRARLSELAPPKEPKPRSVDMPITKDVSAAFTAARKHACGGTVTRLHVPLGIIRASKNISIAPYLADNGVTEEAVEKAIDQHGTS